MINKKSIILTILCSVASVNSAVALDASQKQEQCFSSETIAKQVSSSEQSPKIKLGFRDFIFDCIFGDKFGGQEAPSEIQKYVRDMLKKANVRNSDSVRIRKISTKGIFNTFRSEKNACMVDVPFFPKYMYISEKFFKDLPEDQRKFLVVHEIMHLKYKHALVKIAAVFLVKYIVENIPSNFIVKNMIFKGMLSEEVARGLALRAIAKYIPFPNEISAQVLQFFSLGTDSTVNFLWNLSIIAILQSILNRLCELHADRRAAIEFDNIDGAIGFMNHFISYKKECEQESPQWKFFKWKRAINEKVGKFMNFFSGSHPLFEDRIKWLESLRTA